MVSSPPSIYSLLVSHKISWFLCRSWLQAYNRFFSLFSSLFSTLAFGLVTTDHNTCSNREAKRITVNMETNKKEEGVGWIVKLQLLYHISKENVLPSPLQRTSSNNPLPNPDFQLRLLLSSGFSSKLVCRGLVSNPLALFHWSSSMARTY